jgi:hypothetical protein
MTAIKKITLLIILSGFFQLTFGQINEWSISGSVINKDTKQPLAGASVFISNSTKGTFTDSAGKFSITHLAEGTYNLIISFIGYKTLVFPAEINGKDISVSLAMENAAKELNDVVINLKNGNRKEQLKVFRKAFIGTDKNAKETEILNEDIIKLHTGESGKLTAHSNDFLLIKNNALGYQIKYMLKEFSYNKKTTDLHYLGYPLFEEMKSNSPSQLKEWKENREKIYQTSLLRFYRTLGKRSLIQQGYIIGDLTTPATNEIPHDKGVAARPFVPSLGFLLTLQNRQYVDTLFWPEIPYYKMMTALPGNKYLLNFKGMISVDATASNGEANSTDYYSPGTKTSIITLKQPVRINENGLPQDPSQIIYYGYWMNQRIADLLPFDYQPAENKK